MDFQIGNNIIVEQRQTKMSRVIETDNYDL